MSAALNMAALQSDSSALTRVKSQLYHSGILSHCVLVLAPDSRRPRGNWAAAATLAQLTSSCCVGLDPGKQSKAFHRLFLPQVVDGLLGLAGQLMRRSLSMFRKVMDSVGWLLRAHTRLTAQGQSHISVSISVLICVQTDGFSGSIWVSHPVESWDLWVNPSSSASEVRGHTCQQCQLKPAAGKCTERLEVTLSSGLDNLLDKDWRGRGFDQDVDQLITLIRSDRGMTSPSQVSTERMRAACVIQAAWRSYQTRRRVKSLSRAVGSLQRRYRARRRQQQQQKEAQQWEEELKYQVSIKTDRQTVNKDGRHDSPKILMKVPLYVYQVQSYLQECEQRAAVVIQSFWRGFAERRRYNSSQRDTLRQQRAARTLQRASSRVSSAECQRLHEEVQLLLLSELQRGGQRRREEQRREALLAHTHTQLELLRDAPPLSVVTATVADSFLSPSGPYAARARDAHNAVLQASRLPWWRTLGEPADALCPAHLQELEAEFGGLFVGGSAKVDRPLT
uniref:IQ calmodulin-binding motif-containing protein 1 n=1 Tax=Scophthalmus maximus TaxID=52904 RepID=A0A8D2ZNN8_SCOMX